MPGLFIFGIKEEKEDVLVVAFLIALL